MFICIRKYDGVGDVAEINRIAQAELFPLFSKQAGFVSYSIVNLGNGSAASISVFHTRPQVDAANASIPELVQRRSKKPSAEPADDHRGRSFGARRQIGEKGGGGVGASPTRHPIVVLTIHMNSNEISWRPWTVWPRFLAVQASGRSWLTVYSGGPGGCSHNIRRWLSHG